MKYPVIMIMSGEREKFKPKRVQICVKTGYQNYNNTSRDMAAEQLAERDRATAEYLKYPSQSYVISELIT